MSGVAVVPPGTGYTVQRSLLHRAGVRERVPGVRLTPVLAGAGSRAAASADAL
ncbi:hypothetical protein [Arenivirga flava]|uniref:Uncharacterized protein n=1 Tax=Arenivirga flava TaxID=1930060 RepID=A0AA37UHN6_9MICO|nr:hypothetical protein [Arenivirga flava]GMA29093.1 hypothetical protein GCM10025874_23460 [Arenivirga flava]